MASTFTGPDLGLSGKGAPASLPTGTLSRRRRNAALTSLPGALRPGLAGALLALLAACTTPADGPAASSRAEPVRVILYPDTVTVETSDRHLCTGPRTAPGPGWSGHLGGCPHLWPYRARLPGPRIPRLVLAEGAGGAGRVELDLPSGATRVFSGPR